MLACARPWWFGFAVGRGRPLGMLALRHSCCDSSVALAGTLWSGKVRSHGPHLVGQVRLAGLPPLWLHRTAGLTVLCTRGRLVGRPRRHTP